MHYRDVYVIVIENKVRSLIRTPMGLYQVRALKRCLCYRDEEIQFALQYGLQKDSFICAQCKDIYVVEIGNTVRSLIRAPKGQYQVYALKRCLCSRRYNKYSELFNLDSVGNRSPCYRGSLGPIEMSAIKGCL